MVMIKDFKKEVLNFKETETIRLLNSGIVKKIAEAKGFKSDAEILDFFRYHEEDEEMYAGVKNYLRYNIAVTLKIGIIVPMYRPLQKEVVNRIRPKVEASGFRIRRYSRSIEIESGEKRCANVEVDSRRRLHATFDSFIKFLMPLTGRDLSADVMEGFRLKRPENIWDNAWLLCNFDEYVELATVRNPEQNITKAVDELCKFAVLADDPMNYEIVPSGLRIGRLRANALNWNDFYEQVQSVHKGETPLICAQAQNLGTLRWYAGHYSLECETPKIYTGGTATGWAKLLSAYNQEIESRIENEILNGRRESEKDSAQKLDKGKASNTLVLPVSDGMRAETTA